MVHPLHLLLAVLWCTIAQATALSLPPSTSSTNTTSLSVNKRTIPTWTFYSGTTASQHQANYNLLSSTGYRPISLSLYGQPPNHLYAAVWVQRSGPTYAAIHEATAAQYQAWFDARVGEGYVSKIITATGPESGVRFAGVMEKTAAGVGKWYQKCGLTHDQYISAQLTALGTGYVLKSYTEYGTPTPIASDAFKGRRYCGIWYYSPQTQFYSAYTDQTSTEYQTSYTSETTTKVGWHPSYFAVTEDHLISAQFTNTNIGTWVAVVGMSGAVLQAEYVSQRALGRYIVHLQGGGTGGSVNFAAIWAEGDGLN